MCKCDLSTNDFMLIYDANMKYEELTIINIRFSYQDTKSNTKQILVQPLI